MNDETINQLIYQWQVLEQELPQIRYPVWDKRRKISKRKHDRLSIRTWDADTDWYRMIHIYWMIGSWMHNLSQNGTLTYSSEIARTDALIAAWKLGDYIKALTNSNTRDFIERLQHLLDEIIAAIDNDDVAFFEENI